MRPYVAICVKLVMKMRHLLLEDGATNTRALQVRSDENEPMWLEKFHYDPR